MGTAQADTFKNTTLYQNSRFQVVGSEMKGWRQYMEDTHICNADIGDGNSLFAVFDGHGGPQVADFVSKNLISELTKNQYYLNKNYRQALIQTYMNLDRRLKTPEGDAELNQQRHNASIQEMEAGCTAVTCLVTDTDIYVANAGDSRCFLGINRKAEPMSADHRPENPRAGGMVSQGRVNLGLNISRAIGDFDYKKNKDIPEDEQLVIAKPDVTQRRLKGVQYIVLGSDGIFEAHNQQTVYDSILDQRGLSLKGTVEEILDALVAKDLSIESGLDNMTMIVARVKWP